MPYGDADETDPMTLQGVAFDTDDDSTIREMAACFVEEYARTGFDAERILGLFRVKGYAGPYLAYRCLGEAAIRSLIDETLERRRPRQKNVLCECETAGDIRLTVLNG